MKAFEVCLRDEPTHGNTKIFTILSMFLINHSNVSFNSGKSYTVGIENTYYYLSFVLLVVLKKPTGSCDDFLIEEVLDGERTMLYCISSHHVTRHLHREH